MNARTPPQAWVLFAVALLSMYPAAMALKPRLDEDTWWHLAVGRHIVETGSLPETDPFSRIAREGHVPWVAYSWVYELALYGTHSLLGVDGISYFRYLLAFATIAALCWFATRRVTSILEAAALGLMLTAVIAMMAERPWHFTIVATVLTLHAVVRVREGQSVWRYWWLPLVYVLWANIHIQFVLGIGVLGLAWLATAAERWRRPGDGRGDSRDLFMLLATCAGATLLNPYHVRLYYVIWEYATQTTPLRHIAELRPPNFESWWNWPLAALLVWGAVEVARRRFPTWETLLLASGAFFALRMQRDMWYGCLTAVTVLTRSPINAARPTTRLPGWSVLLAVAAGFALVRVGWQFVELADVHKDNPAGHYPVGAVRYICENGLSGPLYNDFNWGGYLIWALPELPVSLDGRTNLYGEERLGRALRTWAGLPGWDEDPELNAARVIIGTRDQRLTELMLERSDRWRAVYEDRISVVFVPR